MTGAMESLAWCAMRARRWRTDSGSASWQQMRIAMRCRTSSVIVAARRSLISAPSATSPLSLRDSTLRSGSSMRPASIASSRVASQETMALLLRSEIASVARRFPDLRPPLFIELGAQNQRDDEPVASYPGFDPVRLQILVIDRPAGSLQQRPATATQTFRDVVDVTTRTGFEHRRQQRAIGSAHLATQLPVEKHPAAVLRPGIPLHTREPSNEVRL